MILWYFDNYYLCKTSYKLEDIKHVV